MPPLSVCWFIKNIYEPTFLGARDNDNKPWPFPLLKLRSSGINRHQAQINYKINVYLDVYLALLSDEHMGGKAM